MQNKWMRFFEVLIQAIALVSVWRSASAIVMHGMPSESLGMWQAFEPLAIPATVLAVIASIAIAQIRLRGMRKLRKVVSEEKTLQKRWPADQVPASSEWSEQIIMELCDQVARLSAERERLNRLLEEKNLSLHQDRLTGIANRLAYEEQLEQEFRRWQRFGYPLALVVLDIDFFKKINDKHGHDTGDTVLRHVATQLKGQLRSTDFVVRYGGEEFVMLLPGTENEVALKLVDRIRANLVRARFNKGSVQIPVTISCGVSSFKPGDSPRTVFSRADQALYQAKQAGRNCCRMG